MQPVVSAPISPEVIDQLEILMQTCDALWFFDVTGRLNQLWSAREISDFLDVRSLQGCRYQDIPYFDISANVAKEYQEAIEKRLAFHSDSFRFRFDVLMPSVFRLAGFPLYFQGGYLGYVNTVIDLGNSGLMKAIRQGMLAQPQVLNAENNTRALVSHLDAISRIVTEVLHFDQVMIGVVHQHKIETLSICNRGKVIPPVTYAFQNTPCELTLADGTNVINTGIAQLYPFNWFSSSGMQSYAGHRLEDVNGTPIGLICCFNKSRLIGRKRITLILKELSLLIGPYVRNYLAAVRVKDQDELLHQAYRLAKVGAWVHYPKMSGLPTLSQEALKIWGLDPTIPFTMTELLNRVHPDDLAKVEEAWDTSLARKEYRLEYRILVAKGVVKWISERAQVEFDKSGQTYRVVGVIQDITSQKYSEDELQIKSYAVFESSNIVFTMDRRALILDCNPAFESCTGYMREEVMGQSSTLLNAEDVSRAQYWGVWKNLLRGDEWRGEIRNQRKSGEIYWVKTSITPLRTKLGDINRFLCVQEDITEKKEQEARLRYQAHYDLLTDLPNRLLLQETLKLCLMREEPVALLFIDLDGFKNVNDTLGHLVGDELLKRVATRFRTITTQQDTLARLGGDEFVILVHDASKADQMAQRVLNVLRFAFEVSGRPIHLGASIGLVVSPEDGVTADILMRNADAAMYLAKSKGKNTYCRFSRKIYQQNTRRVQVESALRTALKRGELELYFQPQSSLENPRILGAEALCRWHSVDLGHVSPVEFIPLAEETGVIEDIGQWVLEESLRACAEWRQRGLVEGCISINVSPRQFRNQRLFYAIEEGLKVNNLPPSALCVEVTESLLMEDVDQAHQMLLSLRELGVKLAIDDFGVGFSSLNYLKRFPFHSLKIDRSFIRDIVLQGEDRTLVKTIIQMAHNLGLSVIAEGVETAEQFTVLRQMNCEAMQGYWLSEPLESSAFLQLLANASAVLPANNNAAPLV